MTGGAKRFGLIVVGDEILSGKREDAHFAAVRRLLGARGLRLAWVEYPPDERALIADRMTRSFAGMDVVFCCGGIGATPDDHTRQAAGLALDHPLELHPEAREWIAAHAAAQGLLLTPQRLRLGAFPRGARGHEIELGVKGDAEHVPEAFARLREGVARLGGRIA